MNRDEFAQAIAVANGSNNEGVRLEMKIDAVARALLDLLVDEPDLVMVERPVTAVPSAASSDYATHTSQGSSGSPSYEVLPERAKLDRMNVSTLKALAERHGITVPDGLKAEIIDAMIAAAS